MSTEGEDAGATGDPPQPPQSTLGEVLTKTLKQLGSQSAEQARITADALSGVAKEMRIQQHERALDREAGTIEKCDGQSPAKFTLWLKALSATNLEPSQISILARMTSTGLLKKLF